MADDGVARLVVVPVGEDVVVVVVDDDVLPLSVGACDDDASVAGAADCVALASFVAAAVADADAGAAVDALSAMSTIAIEYIHI